MRGGSERLGKPARGVGGGFALEQKLTLQTTLLIVGLPSLIVAALVLLIGRPRAKESGAALTAATA